MPRTVSQKGNETLKGTGLKYESCDEKTLKTETRQDGPEDLKLAQVHLNISRQKQGILLLDHREKLQVHTLCLFYITKSKLMTKCLALNICILNILFLFEMLFACLHI